MASHNQELLSTEIVNRGIPDSGPYAGSLSFSVTVRRGLPDFLSSVNLKYVKLGYGYLINHGFYSITAPVFLILAAQIGMLTSDDFYLKCDLINAFSMIGLLSLVFYIHLDLNLKPRRSTYLVDFACFRPPDELKVTLPFFFIYLPSNNIFLCY